MELRHSRTLNVLAVPIEPSAGQLSRFLFKEDIELGSWSDEEVYASLPSGARWLPSRLGARLSCGNVPSRPALTRAMGLAGKRRIMAKTAELRAMHRIGSYMHPQL